MWFTRIRSYPPTWWGCVGTSVLCRETSRDVAQNVAETSRNVAKRRETSRNVAKRRERRETSRTSRNVAERRGTSRGTSRKRREASRKRRGASHWRQHGRRADTIPPGGGIGTRAPRVAQAEQSGAQLPIIAVSSVSSLSEDTVSSLFEDTVPFGGPVARVAHI